MPHHCLLVSQAAYEASRDSSDFSAQRTGDGPGVFLHVQQKLQAYGTEGVLTAKQLGGPGTVVGLSAHQALQVTLHRDTETTSGPQGNDAACGGGTR